jgi:high-affinity nickel-transport protein
MSFGAAPFGLILLGLTLGMRHATDPDHVIAVTAILTNERRLFRAARIGLVWGLGHSATVLAVGMAIVFFKLKVPVRLGLSMEFIVALVLILLGLGAAAEVLASIAKKLRAASPSETALVVHSHPHEHSGRSRTHRHLHAHSPLGGGDVAAHDHQMAPALAATVSGRSMTKSFVVGLFHGLAGSAAIALLVTAAIPSPLWAMLYMIIFCCGVMLGMMLITTAVGVPFVLAARRLAGVHHRLSVAAGLLSFGFGLFLALQIGIAGQLFGSTPHWSPH